MDPLGTWNLSKTSANLIVILSFFFPGIPGLCAGPRPGVRGQPCGDCRGHGPGGKEDSAVSAPATKLEGWAAGRGEDRATLGTCPQ